MDAGCCVRASPTYPVHDAGGVKVVVNGPQLEKVYWCRDVTVGILALQLPLTATNSFQHGHCATEEAMAGLDYRHDRQKRRTPEREMSEAPGSEQSQSKIASFH